MGYNQSTMGGGGGTAVGNQWANFLGQGLSSGQYGNSSMNGGLPQGWRDGSPYSGNGSPGSMVDWAQSHPASGLNGYTGNFGMGGMGGSSNPSGGMGAPGADPSGSMGQTRGFSGQINNALNNNPSQSFYNNPGNQRPQGYNPTQVSSSYNPTQVGVTPQGVSNSIDRLSNPQGAMNFGFNPQQNPGASNMFNQGQQGQLGIAGMLQNQAFQGAQNPFGGVGMGPGAPGVNSFNSPGILGNRDNVVSAITNAAQLQNQQALAGQNARFTTMGGMSGGTPAAYATAQTQAQSNIGLANALAQSDIQYRNLDLGGYQAQNQANAQNFGTQAQMYGSQLGRLASAGQTGVNALTGAGGQFGNISNQQFGQQGLGYQYGALDQAGQQATNQLNLNSGLGFGQLANQGYYDAGNLGNSAAGLAQQGQQYNNSNAYNASGQAMQGQQYNNMNAYNAGNQALQSYLGQGGMDLQSQGQQYNFLNNMMGQMFGSYNNMFNRGTPQAQTTVTPDAGMNILSAIPGILGGFKGLGGLGGGGGGGGLGGNTGNWQGNNFDPTQNGGGGNSGYYG